MTRSKIPACTLGLILLMAVSAREAKGRDPIPGGWSPAAVTNSEVVAATSFAIREIAIQEKGSSVTLVTVISAEQQVVAGMNFHLVLKVKSNGRERTAEATVWWQAWNKETPYRLTSWKWQ